MLRHLALAGQLDPATAAAAAFRLRLAMAYALCAAVVTADTLATHRADLNGAPPSKVKARSDSSDEDQRRRRPVKGPPAKLRGIIILLVVEGVQAAGLWRRGGDAPRRRLDRKVVFNRVGPRH